MPEENMSWVDLARSLPTEFQQILDALFDEVYVTDGQGMSIYANKACENHYGLKVEELVGRHVKDLEAMGIFTPAVTPFVLRERRTITMEQSTLIGRRMLVTATPVFDDAGEIVMVVCSSRDVTELLHLRNKLHETLELAGRYRSELDRLKRFEKVTSRLVYRSEKMAALLDILERASKTDCVILITGESGVGKDVVARAIHDMSPRANGPFVVVNCGAIPLTLLESELFGYSPGAFTGAKREGKKGLAKAAERGTLFLDEVGDLPLELQGKLLRFVQDLEFIPVGGSETTRVDTRVIAATNKDLQAMVSSGAFREDLYYRLSVVPVHVPPLRERKEDIIPLTQHFLHLFRSEHGSNVSLDRSVLDAFMEYDWPGNVRELRNCLTRLLIAANSETVSREDLPDYLRILVPGTGGTPGHLKDRLELVEAQLIRDTYRSLGSSYKVAEALGISQPSAWRKIKKYCGQGEEGHR